MTIYNQHQGSLHAKKKKSSEGAIHMLFTFHGVIKRKGVHETPGKSVHRQAYMPTSTI